MATKLRFKSDILWNRGGANRGFRIFAVRLMETFRHRKENRK